MREATVEQYLKERAEYYGGEVRKVKWIGRRGAPDRLLLLPWMFCFVELKRPGGKPEAHQLREHHRLREYGVPVVVVDSKEGVDKLLYGAPV